MSGSHPIAVGWQESGAPVWRRIWGPPDPLLYSAGAQLNRLQRGVMPG